MRIGNFLVYGLIIIAFVATSCDKNNDDDGDKFSSLTVEQNKSNIETNAIDMLDEVKALEEEPAIETSILLVDYLASMGSSSINESSIIFRPIFAMANIQSNGVEGMLKSVQTNPTEDAKSIQEVFDTFVGIYNWNSSKNEWDYTETGDVVVFNFPATETSTSNNASYTISYEGYVGVNPIEDYDGDLPKNVTAILKVDNNEISSFIVDVNYDAEGIPTKIETTFRIGAFQWYAMASNNNNAAFATEVSFKHSTTTIMKFKLNAAGDWSEDNIKENYVVTYYAETYDPDTEEWDYIEISEDEIDDYKDTYTWSEEDFKIHKVVKEGNASFQFMNLKIVGAIDALSLGNVLEGIDYDRMGDQEAANAEVEAINKYLSLSLRYVDSDEVIALIEAYPETSEYSYETNYYDNKRNETSKIVTETEYYTDLRFVFADGSKIDAETYFGEGGDAEDDFASLIDAVNDYIDDLDDAYGE